MEDAQHPKEPSMPRTPNALDLLRRDHRHVLALLKQFDKAEAENEQRELCDQIVDELRQHTDIEERVFYPYLREATAREDLFQEASIEHDTAKQLMEQLPKEQAGTPRFRAMVKVLGEYFEHHLKEEETEIFPQVEKTGVDLQALGEALQECREGHDPMADAGRADGERANGHTRKADHESNGNGNGNGHAGNGRAAADRSEAEGDEQPQWSTPSVKDDKRFLKEHGDELSRSTTHAKWIHSTDDQPDHDGQTLATRNLDVIKAWAEARGGRPATSPGGDPERPHVLRFDFPDYDKNLQPVSWEAWGRVFQERELVFLFQEKMKAGNQSNFFRLDNPHREDG
jgi:hemerythrin-like domain-containing protein